MVATVLFRNAGSPATSYRYIFADVEDATPYYAKAAIWAYDNGIVTGTGEDKEALNKSNTAERERYAERAIRFSMIEPCETYTFSENPYFVDPTHGDYTLIEGADIFDCQFAKIGRY
ncbi:MAG: S-layer homology domain-containing protein [Clostridia bacterium]|nr:S-layer homology domain-containing protein [Clostridia bacterium]